MIQCFPKKLGLDIFIEPYVPKLIHISKLDHDYSMFPRIMHKHDNTLEVMLIRDGTGVYIIDEKRYNIKAGDLIFFNSHILHDEAPEYNQNLSAYCIGISNFYLDNLPSNCIIPDSTCPILASGKHFSYLKELLELIYFQLASEKPHAEVVCNYLMISFIYIVLQLLQDNKFMYNNEKEENYLLGKRIKKYIDERYTQKLSLNSIAKALNMSPYYLAHTFKEATGYSPVQYIVRRRIGEAQTLLIHTTDPVRKIAEKVGYSNPSYFNAQFVKYVGMAPREYRKIYIERKP